MPQLLPIETHQDIPLEYRGTPLGDLLEYHNLERPFEAHDRAKLLVGMCIDNRKHLNIPDNFSFIIRAGGANLRASEFKVSFAIAIGGVQHLALIGHSHCGMVGLKNRRQEFIEGLVARAGWTPEEAESHFESHEPNFEIHNEIDFVLSETQRLRKKYPKIHIAPMLYRVEDNRLYLIRNNA